VRQSERGKGTKREGKGQRERERGKERGNGTEREGKGQRERERDRQREGERQSGKE